MFYSLAKMTSARSLVVCSLLICALTVPAQEAAPPGFEQWTTKGLGDPIAELRREAPEDPHHFAVRQLADFSNDSYLLVHRARDGQVEWHETQADVFFVLSGTATLVMGGQMVHAETVGPHEKRNGAIVGGLRRPLVAGDIVRIPPRMPHQVLLHGSPEFNYFVVKIKGY